MICTFCFTDRKSFEFEDLAGSTGPPFSRSQAQEHHYEDILGQTHCLSFFLLISYFKSVPSVMYEMQKNTKEVCWRGRLWHNRDGNLTLLIWFVLVFHHSMNYILQKTINKFSLFIFGGHFLHLFES